MANEETQRSSSMLIICQSYVFSCHSSKRQKK